MAELIEHSGVVEAVEQTAVCVKITSQSACAACHARQACGLGESQEKIIVVRTADAGAYHLGDAVLVGVRRGAGAKAVALAYVGALVVLLAVLVIGITFLGWAEGPAALASLLAVGLYYGVLWLVRRKIEHTIHFTITKL